jgi:aspartate aminotransferase
MTRPHAHRLDRVEESPTVAITDLVNELERQGRDILAFNVGEPDFDTPDVVKEAAKDALDDGHTGYTSSWGLPKLREAIARKCREDEGIPADKENVLVAPAKQALFYAIVGTVDPGDEVILPDPAWVTYEPLVRLAGGTPVRAEAGPETDFRMTPEAVQEVLSDRTRLILAVSPSNPTGGLLEPADVRGVAQLAQDHDVDVLSDEVYNRIVYEGEPTSFASLPGMASRTMTVNGFSKSHAMTGWRLGWLVAPRDLLEEVVKLQQHTLTHPTTFAMHAGVAALKMDPEPLDEMVETFRERRDVLVDGLREIPGFDCFKPPGAFYAFPSFDHDVSSQEMAEHLIEEVGVATTPGSAFGPGGEGHLRFSYAVSRATIEDGLERIEEAVADLPR